MVVLVVVGAVLVCAAVMILMRVGGGRSITADADRFAAARAMTNRWAEDPTSTPKPVLEIAQQRSESVPAAMPADAANDG